MNSLKSVLVEVFRFWQAGGTTASVEHDRIMQYGATKDFRDLWNELEKKSGTYVIIWDQIPYTQSFGQVDVNAHLTPLHWAACAGKRSPNELDVWILDLNPSGHGSNDLYKSFAYFNIPWLHILNPADVFESRPLQPQSRNEREGSVELLLGCIRSIMTSDSSREDRHALANALSPLLLMSEYRLNDPHAGALRAVAHDCGFSADTDSCPPKLTLSDQELPKEVVFKLLDDMVNFGWAEWLEDVLEPLTGRIRNVDVYPDPNSILPIWEQLLTYRVKHRGPAVLAAEPSLPILFLDLRLFSPDNVLAEAAFYKELLKLWKTLEGAFGIEQLPWPCHWKGGDLRRLKAWCDQQNPSPDETMQAFGRILLPSFLAQLDPLQPIILFSSSTDQDVIRQLNGYGNVITSFSKPTIFGSDSLASFADAKVRMAKALRSAADILRVRERCGGLLRLQGESKRHDLGNKRAHVEFFVDESGSGQSVIDKVGGVFAVHVGNNPVRQADEFDDLAVKSGLRYFDYFNALQHEQPLPRILLKQLDNGLLQCKEALGAAAIPPQLGYLELSLGGGHKEEEVDSNYWNLLQSILEIFVGEVLPRISEETCIATSNVSFSLYVGTRSRERSGSTGDRDLRGGFHIQRGKKILVRTMDYNDAYWIYTGIRLGRGLSARPLRRATGVQLPYKGEYFDRPDSIRLNGAVFKWGTLDPAPTDSAFFRKKGLRDPKIADARFDYRALHYLSDQILRWGRTVYEPVLQKPTVLGQFDDILDDNVQGALRAGRLLDNGDLARAIAEMKDPEKATGAKALVGQRLARALTELTGHDVLHLRNLLSQAPTKN